MYEKGIILKLYTKLKKTNKSIPEISQVFNALVAGETLPPTKDFYCWPHSFFFRFSLFLNKFVNLVNYWHLCHIPPTQDSPPMSLQYPGKNETELIPFRFCKEQLI